MHVLDKLSYPGWEFKSNHIEHILWMLDRHICDACKITEQDYLSQAEFDFEPEEGINPYTLDEFKPETYDQWSDLEKVEWLLGTACGCEFDFKAY